MKDVACSPWILCCYSPCICRVRPKQVIHFSKLNAVNPIPVVASFLFLEHVENKCMHQSETEEYDDDILQIPKQANARFYATLIFLPPSLPAISCYCTSIRFCAKQPRSFYHTIDSTSPRLMYTAAVIHLPDIDQLLSPCPGNLVR